MRRHLLPLVMAPVWVEASFGVAGAVVAEAGLFRSWGWVSRRPMPRGEG